MWCPKCGHETTRVIGTDKANFVRRFRRCVACSHNFITFESVKFDDQWKIDAKYSDPLNQQGVFDKSYI